MTSKSKQLEEDCVEEATGIGKAEWMDVDMEVIDGINCVLV